MYLDIFDIHKELFVLKKLLIKTLIAVNLFSFTGLSVPLVQRPVVVQAQSIVEALGNPTVYYTPNGKSFHLTKSCSRLSRSKTIYSGALKDVILKKSDPCDFCVKIGSSSNTTNTTQSTSTSGNNQSSNSNSQSTKVTEKPNVNKEELDSYLKDSYTRAFGRDIDQEALDYWTGMFTEGKVTFRSFISVLVNSSEFREGVKDATDTVKRLYGLIFVREADDEGIRYWTSKLGTNFKSKISNVANGMTSNKEAKDITTKLGVLY